MGGVGYGLRSNKGINPMNPASYTSIDSLTFLFDFGVAGQMSWFNDGLNKEKHLNGNLEYIALQFPVSRRLALSAGLLPFSYVGYNYSTTSTTDGLTSTTLYTGTGGLSEIYVGGAFDIWKKRLSLGANVGYLFGANNYQQTLSISSTGASSPTRVQSLSVSDLKLDFGLQYTHPLSLTKSLVFGLAYSPAKRLHTTSSDITTVAAGSTSELDTLSLSKNHAFDLPNTYGFGFSFVNRNKLTVAADVRYQTWKNARFFDEKDEFKNLLRLGGGIEYIPAYVGENYLHKVRYRAGLHYSNSYLKIKGASYDEWGAGIGLGLPLMDNRSLLNIGLEYVNVHPDAPTLIREQYFRISVNYTFNERWFFKFKVD
jgi:hypothetical protein